MSTFEDFLATFESDPGYLNWASFGPLSPSVRAEVFADADLLGSGRPSSLALVAERIQEAKQLASDMLGAEPEEITIQPSATHGLMHALYGLSGTVLASTADFPSITVTLDRAAANSAGAITPRWITPDFSLVTPEVVADALDDEVTALVVSHVDFRTGYRADLDAFRDILGPDRLLIVDAVQSFGVVDADFSVADVVVGHGYKWLRAGRGSGFARFSPAARERIAPVLSGFAGTEIDIPVDVLPAPAATAQAYVVNAPDQLAVARLAVGIRDIKEAGIADIEAMVTQKVDRVFEIADSHGIPVRTPRDPARRAGIVSLVPEEPARLSASLSNMGIVATTRGGHIRIAPHAGTGEDSLQMLDDAIGAVGQGTFISA